MHYAWKDSHNTFFILKISYYDAVHTQLIDSIYELDVSEAKFVFVAFSVSVLDNILHINHLHNVHAMLTLVTDSVT